MSGLRVNEGFRVRMIHNNRRKTVPYRNATHGRGIVLGINAPIATNAAQARHGKASGRLRSGVLTLAGLVGLVPGLAVGETTDESTNLRRESSILRQAPADSVAILYSRDIVALGGHYLLPDEAILPPKLDSFLRTLLRPVDREIMLAVSGAPPNPFNTRITLAARTTMTRAELFKYVDEDLVPMLSGLKDDTSVEFWKSEGVGHLTLTGPLTLSFDIAWRDGMFVLTNVMGQAAAFASGDQATPTFIDTPDYDRIAPDDSNTSTAHMLYLNLRPWVGLAQAELNDTLPKLYEATQLGRLQFVALQQTDTVVPIAPAEGTDRSTTATDKSSTNSNREADVRQRAAAKPSESDTDRNQSRFETRRHRLMHLGLIELTPGPWQWLGSTPAGADLAESFPPGTMLFLDSGMKSGKEPWANVKTFVGTFAPEIVAEYEKEREEFRRDIGFDPETEFLTNLGDEWALGVIGGEPTGALFAIKLKSASTFRAHMHQLRTYFDLKTDSTTYRGVAIEQALRPRNPSYFAVADDVLLIAGQRKIITRAIDAREDNESLATQERFRRARMQAMDEATSKLAYVDFVGLLSDAAAASEFDNMPELRSALHQLQAVIVAVTPQDDALRLEWAWTADQDQSVAPMIVDALAASLRQARQQAKRAVAIARVQSIVTACHVSARQNDNRWPSNLHELAGNGTLGTLKEAGRILANPYDPPEEVVRIMPWYVYQPVEDFKSIKDPATTPVVCEPAIRDGGLVVGFADAHVEWIPQPRADEILKAMKSDG